MIKEIIKESKQTAIRAKDTFLQINGKSKVLTISVKTEKDLGLIEGGHLRFFFVSKGGANFVSFASSQEVDGSYRITRPSAKHQLRINNRNLIGEIIKTYEFADDVSERLYLNLNDPIIEKLVREGQEPELIKSYKLHFVKPMTNVQK